MLTTVVTPDRVSKQLSSRKLDHGRGHDLKLELRLTDGRARQPTFCCPIHPSHPPYPPQLIEQIGTSIPKMKVDARAACDQMKEALRGYLSGCGGTSVAAHLLMFVGSVST